jgi:hypothetical protein
VGLSGRVAVMTLKPDSRDNVCCHLLLLKQMQVCPARSGHAGERKTEESCPVFDGYLAGVVSGHDMSLPASDKPSDTCARAGLE